MWATTASRVPARLTRTSGQASMATSGYSHCTARTGGRAFPTIAHATSLGVGSGAHDGTDWRDAAS
eukprot:4458366-Alexandrium_andersonii.AAC.1